MYHRPHLVGSVCAIVACCLALPTALAAERFSLQVNDVSGLNEPWPLVGGLPFPEGALHDASQIRVMRDGEEVPAQIDVAATWRDGSIRWALAGFTAPPNGEYTVEFGPDVTRRKPEAPLAVQEDEDGALTVDTGQAVYAFASDKLLPELATMGRTTVLEGAGDGAYLVDNQGRTARVSGTKAEITTELLKRGPARLVVHRKGWYVTPDGERVARAKMWFYFAAGSPYVRMTHSLVFTRNTNELWVRDYGLELDTPRPAKKVAFALSNPAPKESVSRREGSRLVKDQQYHDFAKMFSGMHGRAWRLFETEPAGDELYMLQEDYPHHFERDFHAVIGRVSPERQRFLQQSQDTIDNLWLHDWEKQMQVAGDWAEARYGDHALTVVTPWMAQRFPKEIAFSQKGARVAFWSGRSGRALDFRPVTLVNQYWKTWAQGAAEGASMTSAAATRLAGESTNAQGAARTHKLWLLPRTDKVSTETLKARATAAARPPLVLADPQWLTATEAIGWPMHHKDTQRFSKAEAVISDFWTRLTGGRLNSYLRRTGFITWGLNPFIMPAHRHYRIGSLTDYGLRRHAWGLYARSGERRYWEYASRFNRFAGDWSVAHWNAGDKRRGAFVDFRTEVPFYWGVGSQMWHGVTGHGVRHWLMQYQLTGDEHAADLMRMIGEAYKVEWNPDKLSRIVARNNGIYSILGVLADLYSLEGDEQLKRMAQQLASELIDLDNPTGRSDNVQYGVLYKVHRSLYNLYDYYRVTGDETARTAILKSLEHDYRFHRIRGAFSGQSYGGLLYSIGYRWSGRRHYLRVVRSLVQEHRRGPSRTAITSQIHPFGAMPTALGLMAEVDEAAVEPYPVLDTDEPQPITFRKPKDKPVEMSIFVRMSNDVPNDAQTVTNVTPRSPTGSSQTLDRVRVHVEQMFRTRYDGRRDPRRRYVALSVPAKAPAGHYTLALPNTSRIVVLDSNAPEIGFVSTE